MKHLAVGTTLVLLLALLPESWGQAPVLSAPVEDATSPQLIAPISQNNEASSRASQSDYGLVIWAIQPISATVDTLLPQQTAQPRLPSQAASATASLGGPSTGVLNGAASTWSAGGPAVAASLPGRMVNSSPASIYPSASSFTPRALPPTGTGTAGGTLTAAGSNSISMQAVQASRRDRLIKETAGFVPGAPQRFQGAAPLSGDPGDAAATTQSTSSPNGSSQTAQTQTGNGVDDGRSSYPFSGLSSSHMEALKPRGLDVPLVTVPSSEGMTIRLIATADGIQLVLQTKNALNGSILGDQSGISRHGGNFIEGWWSWGAGAGSWAPADALTASPSRYSMDPGDALINKMVPKSKLDKTSESSNGAFSQQ